MVVFKHVQNSRPQEFEVLFRKAGRLAREIRRHIALRAVEAVRHDVLAAHFGVLLFRVRLGRDGDARDGHLLRQNGVDASGKAELHRPTHLTAVERTLGKGRHHRAERADIVEIGTHEVANFFIQMLVLFLGFLQLIGVCADVGTGLFIARVQRYAVFDVDAVAFFALFCHFNIIADLALEANVRHKAIAGLGVDARHIARIGITVRIAVFHVEQHHKFITVLDGIRHFLSPPFSYSASASDDSSQGRTSPAERASCARDSFH